MILISHDSQITEDVMGPEPALDPRPSIFPPIFASHLFHAYLCQSLRVEVVYSIPKENNALNSS